MYDTLTILPWILFGLAELVILATSFRSKRA